MGDIADYYKNQELHNDFDHLKTKNMEKLYWTTKDGRRLNVDDMDDNHVRNAFKMLLRKLKLHGDMANEFNNSFPEDDCDASIVDIEP